MGIQEVIIHICVLKNHVAHTHTINNLSIDVWEAAALGPFRFKIQTVHDKA